MSLLQVLRIFPALAEALQDALANPAALVDPRDIVLAFLAVLAVGGIALLVRDARALLEVA